MRSRCWRSGIESGQNFHPRVTELTETHRDDDLNTKRVKTPKIEEKRVSAGVCWRE
jgi:hypothetical protein